MRGESRCHDAASTRASNLSSEGATSTTGKMAFLPRLRRQEQLDAVQAASGASMRPSMAERLAQMRVEDRRRARNEELRSAAANGNLGNTSNATTSSLRAEAAVFHPSSTSMSTNGSASSRAGSLYLSAAQLARQDSQELQRESAIRRKFAGPAPPSSWQGSEGQERSKEQKDEQGGKRKEKDRKDLLRATRTFFGGENSDERHGMSLVDLSLIAILEHASNESERQSDLCYQMCYMPSHLKERCLALSGRLARAQPMTDAILSCLFREDDEPYTTPTQMADRSLENARLDEEEEEEDDELPDAWDADSSPELMHSSSPLRCSVLDLSFARASSRAVRSLLKDFAIQPGQLQALSLAGWGNTANDSRRSVEKTLRASTSLFNVLDQMVNLQKLSLAASKLLPGSETDECVEEEEEEEMSSHSARSTSEAIAFLKKLSRRTPRLVLLDLTACQWVNGAVIANVGWYSTNLPVRRLAWPQLSYLVLTDCSAFSAVDGTDKRSVDLRESSGFAGAWHAAHHGSTKQTQSPYFLAHKPGLGRALLAHGVDSWNVVSGRNTLVDREAAALARHGGHVRPTVDEQRTRSAFDDDSDQGGVGARSNFAIAHGVAPFSAGARRHPIRDPIVRQRVQGGRSNNSDNVLLPRCPVNGSRVTKHEWERARVLDAVRGRWGSAILGTLLDDEGEGGNEQETLTKKRASIFTSVYF